MFFSVCRVCAVGPPEMDLPEFVEDTRDGTFHKDISTEGLLGLLRHSHGYHRFVQCEGVFARQIVPKWRVIRKMIHKTDWGVGGISGAIDFYWLLALQPAWCESDWLPPKVTPKPRHPAFPQRKRAPRKGRALQ